MKKLILGLIVTGTCLVSMHTYAEPLLYLQFDGSDGSTVFLDSSPTGHIVTGHGNAQIDVDEKILGTGSLLLDGEGDYLELPDSSDWDIGTNFTIDLWVKPIYLGGGYSDFYIAQKEDDNNWWAFAHQDVADRGLGFHFEVDNDAKIHWDIFSGGRITDNNWHHVALCKVGNEFGIYKDGQQVAYATATIQDTFSAPLYIGTEVSTTAVDFEGHMDEIRIQHSNYFNATPNPSNTDVISPIPNESPIADAGEDVFAMAGETVLLDGGYSYDPDGTIVLYEWIVFSDPSNPVIGQGETFEMIAHGYAEEIIQLRVTDDTGAIATDTMKIINPGIEGPMGPQGPPGIAPEEIAAMQSQITTLQQQNADQQKRLEEDRYLLEQLPQLQKDLETLQQQVQ